MTYVAVLTLMPGIMGEWGPFVGVALPLVSIGVSLTLGVWLAGPHQRGAFGAIGLCRRLACHGPDVAVLGAGRADGGVGPAAGREHSASCRAPAFASIPQLNRTLQDRARAAGAIAQLGNVGTVSGTPVLALLLQWAAGVTRPGAVPAVLLSLLGVVII